MEEKNNAFPPEYIARPEQFVQYGGHLNQYVGQPAPYVGQPETNTPVVVQPNITIHTPAPCDKSKMPSVACPIFACICFWPFGIAALAYYLRAQGSQGTNDDPVDYSKSILCARNWTIAAIVIGVASILVGVGMGVYIAFGTNLIVNNEGYYGIINNPDYYGY